MPIPSFPDNNNDKVSLPDLDVVVENVVPADIDVPVEDVIMGDAVQPAVPHNIDVSNPIPIKFIMFVCGNYINTNYSYTRNNRQMSLS